VTWAELDECDPGDFTLRTMPERFASIGDRHADIDRHPCGLDSLLELSARQEAEGLGDAPWPPHYRKQEGEPPRVQPSKRRPGDAKPSGRRVSTKPLLEIAKAQRKEDALAGLERWKATHPEAAAHLEAQDVLVDSMRGRSSIWWRVRVNLEHVPEGKRPPQEALESDYDPWAGVQFTEEEIAAWKASQRAKARARRQAKKNERSDE
jgi:hypothetical protein